MKKILLLALLVAACGGQGSPGSAGAPGTQGPQGPQGPAGTEPYHEILCNGDDSDDAYLVTYQVTNGQATFVVSSGECGFSGVFNQPGSYANKECGVSFDGQAVTCWKGN